MADLAFLTPHMSTPEFAKMTNVALATINDWRKRNMLVQIGQAHPQRDGRWIYAPQDALSIHLAQSYVASNVKWRDALFLGSCVSNILTAQRMYGARQPMYQGRFLLFYGGNVGPDDYPTYVQHDRIEMVMDEVFIRAGASICQLVDLTSTVSRLPRQFLDGLASLEATD